MRPIGLRSLLAVFALVGCAAARPSPPPAQLLSPSEVTRSAQSLKGKTVNVSGYLILADEAHALWDSQADADEVVRRRASGGDPIWSRCIAIYFDRKVGRTLKKPTRGNIVATGTIGVTDRAKDGVDLWACSDIYIEVHRLVRK
ncbi:MAG TPA: hypothetical protein VEA60_05275 [Allosphingosinicella sp.]|nr:hypothetical protein [Allosphingosinicella sp.]